MKLHLQQPANPGAPLCNRKLSSNRANPVQIHNTFQFLTDLGPVTKEEAFELICKHCLRKTEGLFKNIQQAKIDLDYYSESNTIEYGTWARLLSALENNRKSES